MSPDEEEPFLVQCAEEHHLTGWPPFKFKFQVQVCVCDLLVVPGGGGGGGGGG